MTTRQHDWRYAVMRAIWCYLSAVAADVGLAPESVTVIADVPDYTGYLALGPSLGRFPGMELLLIWDSTTGWSAAVEVPDGAVIALCYLADRAYPPPEEVAAFLRAARAGESPGRLEAPRFDLHVGDLTRALARYTGADRPCRRSAVPSTRPQVRGNPCRDARPGRRRRRPTRGGCGIRTHEGCCPNTISNRAP